MVLGFLYVFLDLWLFNNYYLFRYKKGCLVLDLNFS
jgi:hypothetical protein